MRKVFEAPEADMTPMIDVVFQLIAFFMVLVNFTQVDQDARVVLPTSVLAKPPKEQPEQPLTLQFTKTGTVLISGEEIEVGPALEGVLRRERRALGRMDKAISEVVVIIRAHKDAPTGKVLEAIEVCQAARFERFRLRVKEDTKSRGNRG